MESRENPTPKQKIPILFRTEHSIAWKYEGEEESRDLVSLKELREATAPENDFPDFNVANRLAVMYAAGGSGGQRVAPEYRTSNNKLQFRINAAEEFEDIYDPATYIAPSFQQTDNTLQFKVNATAAFADIYTPVLAWGSISGELINQTDVSTAISTAAGTAAWGSISGELINQTDVSTAIGAAAETAVWGSISGELINQTDVSTAIGAAAETALWGSISGELINQTDVSTAIGTAAETALWGSISGDLEDQSDLQGVLDNKLESADIAYMAVTNADNNFSVNQTIVTAKIGSATDYTEFESDGTIHFIGAASVFLDMLGDLTTAGRAGQVAVNMTEGVVDYAANATTQDFSFMNVQLNHFWKPGSSVHPHVHWFQTSNATPNWMIQYRWQRNSQDKTTSWTGVKWTSNAFDYVTGTLNQITSFPLISAPMGYSISDILQIQLIRDSNNASLLFTGPDAYSGAASATSLDVHVEVDTIGSRTEFAK